MDDSRIAIAVTGLLLLILGLAMVALPSKVELPGRATTVECGSPWTPSLERPECATALSGRGTAGWIATGLGATSLLGLLFLNAAGRSTSRSTSRTAAP